jgi:hypothetical protein
MCRIRLRAKVTASDFLSPLRGMSSYQLASIIAGGPAPLIAAALFARYRSGYAIAGYIVVCALISIVSAAMLTDYTNKDISEEYRVA